MLDSEVRPGLKPTAKADFVSGSEIELVSPSAEPLEDL